ncbi:MAG: hypothetical protein ACKV2V_06805 [Blastocatellia bacterium]
MISRLRDNIRHHRGDLYRKGLRVGQLAGAKKTEKGYARGRQRFFAVEKKETVGSGIVSVRVTGLFPSSPCIKQVPGRLRIPHKENGKNETGLKKYPNL